MNKCGHEISKDNLKTNRELPKSLTECDDYVLVGKDCKLNKSRLYSRYCFLKKEVCDKCKEESNNAK